MKGQRLTAVVVAAVGGGGGGGDRLLEGHGPADSDGAVLVPLVSLITSHYGAVWYSAVYMSIPADGPGGRRRSRPRTFGVVTLR